MKATAVIAAPPRTVTINDIVEIFKDQGQQGLSLGEYTVHDAADFLDIQRSELIERLTRGMGKCAIGHYFLKLTHPL